jgi:ATP-binding cassette, subfamily B, bacterial MsbA
MLMAKYSLKLYHRLLKYVWPFWPAIIVAALGNILCAAVDSYSTYLFKPLLDKGFIGKDLHFLALLPWTIIGLFVARGIGSVSSRYYMGYISKKIVMIFREQMFGHIMRLPAQFFDQSASARLLSRLTYNVDQIIQATGVTFTILVQQSFFLLGLIIVMFITNWHLTLLIFIVLPFLVTFVRYVSNRFRKLSRRIQNAMGDVMHVAEESILGYRAVKIFGGEAQQISQFRERVKYNFVQEMKVTLMDALSSPIIQVFCSIILALVIYFAVGRPGHEMSPGSFIAMLTAMLAAFKPIRDLSQVNSSIQRGLAAAEGIFALLDEAPEPDAGTKILHKVRGDMRLENISFRYQETQSFVLEDINLHIPAGKTVALVGRSGSGKSSLVSLLTRFYTPTLGKILLEDTDIQEIKLNNLRSHFAMVSQHVTLFDDTVLRNVAYGDKQNASESEVIAALKIAHAWEFVQRLPQGLNTIIGENGLNLSGGQRQRIAIARAILKHAPILILDEATSALDNESERAIQAALEELRRDHTVIVIAHRLSTIENADLIVVMDQGRIVEQGTHQELLKQRGLYAQLHESASFS